MLMEVVAAALILVIGCALLTQLLFLSARQERGAEARQLAWRTAANELETLAAKEWTELVPGEPKTEPAPAELRQLLPAAELRTVIKSHEDDFVREVRVEIVWKTKSGAAAEPVRLAVWKHRPAAEAQP